MTRKVEEFLNNQVHEKGTIHMTLIDPEEVTSELASSFACESELAGSTAIMVGGTTLVSPNHLDEVVTAIKRVVQIPVILFPNNLTGITSKADAIWFMSLLNSADPYFIAGVQVLAAPLIRKFNLEAIPLGYIIIGEGGSAGVIGKACPIPFNKPELAVAHSLAAEYMGMRFVYLEGGSGVSQPVPSEMISMVKKVVSIPVIVGGGIRTGKQAEGISAAGADVVVTSTALEESKGVLVKKKIKEITEGIRRGVDLKLRLNR